MLLVVDSETPSQTTVLRYCRKHVRATGVASVAAALCWDVEDIDGLVVAARLVDGSGFTVIEHVRARRAELPALLLISELDEDCLDAAYVQGIGAIGKPVDPLALGAFLRRAILPSERHIGGYSRSVVHECAQRWQLTRRQTEIMALLLRGERPRDIPAALGVSRNTFRSHARVLMQKTGAATLAEITQLALRHVPASPSLTL